MHNLESQCYTSLNKHKKDPVQLIASKYSYYCFLNCKSLSKAFKPSRPLVFLQITFHFLVTRQAVESPIIIAIKNSCRFRSIFQNETCVQH